MSNIDLRKEGLKRGLRQLTDDQLQRVLTYDQEMVLDEFNYHDGKFCPLAVGVGLDQWLENPSHEKVFHYLSALGYSVNNTKGLKGDFYTTERKRDLLIAAREVLDERKNGH